MTKDSAPEGWQGTVEHMKSHSEIDNPFALAHWMANQGYHPHDGMHADVLDAAHEMYCGAGHNDGPAYTTVGGKPDEVAETDLYEQETENLAPFNEENEDMTDDEKLLEDSEVATGEHLAETETPASDPPPKNIPTGITHIIGDPDPENSGDKPVEVEGEEANDNDEDMLDE
jgi:hypothetical protein